MFSYATVILFDIHRMLEKLCDGSIAVTGQDFPVFLYLPRTYNEDDVLCGMMHGPLLLAV